MALIPPSWLDAVVAIGFPDSDGEPSFDATGFLYARKVGVNDAKESLYRVFLATNRHVFEDSPLALLRFNPSGETPARVYNLDLSDHRGGRLWTPHPTQSIDVAVIPIALDVLRQHEIQFAYFHDDSQCLRRDAAREYGLSEGDGVFVLGFPMGLIGGERNFVVLRDGVIARIRDWLAGASAEFLIDALIFPGNSGGPVVTRPEFTAIAGTKSSPSAYLIGMVSSYLPYTDVAVSLQTKRARVTFEENSGLAAIVPIDHVTEAIDAALAKENAEEPSP